MQTTPSRRESTVNSAGPSVLSKSFSIYNNIHEVDPALDPDFEPANQDFYYDPPLNDSPLRMITSFYEVKDDENDEDDAAEVEKEITSQVKKKVDKGKSRPETQKKPEQHARLSESSNHLKKVSHLSYTMNKIFNHLRFSST
jgi:centromere protein C